MDRLRGDELALACRVVADRYKACVKSAMLDVLASGDVDAPTKRCGALFSDLTAHCAEVLRTQSGGAAAAAGAAAPQRTQR